MARASLPRCVQWRAFPSDPGVSRVVTALGAAWLGVLALHIVWLAMFPNVSGRLVAALGAVLAVGLFVAAHRAAPLLQESWPATLNRPRWAVLFVSIFLLPVLTLAGSLQVAFLRLNGRAWLILAWIVATALVCMLRAFERPGPASGARSVSPLVVLFILWTSMFWLSAIWDLGVGRAVVELQRGPSGCQFDRLATVFSIWETYSPREHLFLGWWSLADFKAHQAYANHVHPYS